jgi:REP-associated tyrosine transposase
VAHAYVKTLVHCVFSTKERRKLIHPDLQERLFPYLGGIARSNGLLALAVGGVEDHVHLLLSLPSTMPVAKAVQLIKGGSSKWVHETFPGSSGFAWQEGYGAFSIGVSQVERTSAYIRDQAEHHRVLTFQEEFLQFLRTHEIEYDPRYIWG